MNLSEITYPKDTKNHVRDLLVQEARRRPKPARRWLSFPVVIAIAGTALVGTTAAGIYTALAPVNDKRDIRCYFHADLTTVHHLKPPQQGTMPPYITTGIFDAGFDAKNGASPEDPNAGMKQVSDPVNQCSRAWSQGIMNPDGITNDLIPADFVPPAPGTGVPGDKYKDQNGNPLMSEPGLFRFGQYIPHLTECVADNTVAVIPGGPDVCARLGIPSLQK
jgi:hypothetical protein